MRVCAILVMVSIGAGATASAQSLADVARKESERRQEMKDSGKTYTNKDLKPVPASPSDAAAPAGDAAATDTAGASKADDQKKPEKSGNAEKTGDKGAKADEKADVKDEAYWSKRMASLREQLERDQTFQDALQSRINALTTDFVNRDDPAQKRQIGIEREKAIAELDRVRKAIEDDKRAIPDLEDEARRAGVPAGWLR